MIRVSFRNDNNDLVTVEDPTQQEVIDRLEEGWRITSPPRSQIRINSGQVEYMDQYSYTTAWVPFGSSARRTEVRAARRSYATFYPVYASNADTQIRARIHYPELVVYND